MKKRILLISLALVLILMLAIPTTALANNDKCKPGSTNTDFSGSGLIYIYYMPEPAIEGNIWRYQGEIVEGYLLESDWDALAGTAFWSDHDSTVRVADDGGVRGVMKGDFTMTRFDGTGVLKGTFEGKISGNLFTGDIYDTGTWKSTGGTGVFKSVKAWGKWSAELHAGLIPGTEFTSLVGPVIWEGKYTSPCKPVIKPWKPGNMIKPGKPTKPWKPVRP